MRPADVAQRPSAAAMPVTMRKKTFAEIRFGSEAGARPRARHVRSRGRSPRWVGGGVLPFARA